MSHEFTLRYLATHDLIDIEEVSTSTDLWRYVDANGRTEVEEVGRYRFTSWNAIHKALLSHFDDDRYHLGSEVTGFEDLGDEVEVRFSDRPTERVRSAGAARTASPRPRAPGCSRVATRRTRATSGWRGTVPEAELAPETAATAGEAIIYRLLEDSHILTYPIPNHDGEVAPGQRADRTSCGTATCRRVRRSTP